MTKFGCSSSFGSMTCLWRRRESNPRYVPARFKASSELLSDAFARVQSVATSPVCLVSTRQALPAPKPVLEVLFGGTHADACGGES